MSHNYFDIFKLPQKLNIDHNELKKQFTALKKQYTSAKDEGLEHLTQAYQTLKERLSRADYFLKSQGHNVEKETTTPPEAFQHIYDTAQKYLEQIQNHQDSAKAALKTLHQEILTEFSHISLKLTQLEKEWDSNTIPEKSVKILKRLKKTVTDFHFIKNLENKIRSVVETK